LFTLTEISPLFSVIVLQASPVMSIVAPSPAAATASRRLPDPVSLQFAATMAKGGVCAPTDCAAESDDVSGHAVNKQAASGRRIGACRRTAISEAVIVRPPEIGDRTGLVSITPVGAGLRHCRMATAPVATRRCLRSAIRAR
jgi:hypothetical protein